MDLRALPVVASLALGTLVTTPAWALKPCEELKSEIEAGLTAKGVKNFVLEILATEQVKNEKVVGSCEGGKKKITYRRE
jgi:hypothetical protein